MVTKEVKNRLPGHKTINFFHIFLEFRENLKNVSLLGMSLFGTTV